MKSLRGLSFGALALGMCLAPGAFGQTTVKMVPVSMEVPSVVQQAALKSHVSPTMVHHIVISLPFANPTGIKAFADSVSDPANANYRKFITPTEVGTQFGQPQSVVDSITTYLKSKGLTITSVADSHLTISADGTTTQLENAFNTTLNNYHATNANEPGRVDFMANSQVPQLPSTIAPKVLDIAGLETFYMPKPRAVPLTPTQTRVLYNTAPLYTGLGQHGEGRNIAISNFDGFRLSNVPLYYSQFGLPSPSGGVGSNITTVVVDGGSGTGTPSGEADLDIQMVLGMAPLCNFRIYDGNGTLTGYIDTLTRETQDNIADIISESYGWNLPGSTALAAHNQHIQMTAQGITYMAAAGDSGTSLEPFSYPNWDGEVLMIGGTIATTDATGNRTDEVAWSGGGGGWSQNSASFNVRPSWQKGNGVPTNVNFRMSPDLSLNAAGNNTGAYQFYFNGSLSFDSIGTSFACPVFAGMLGVGEQYDISLGGLAKNSAGKQRLGRIQDVVYSQNGIASIWHDITQGNNGTLPDGSTSNAKVGWDFCSGWGCMNIKAFFDAISVKTTPVTALAKTVSIYGGLGQKASGSVSQLTKTDGSYYIVGSVNQPGLGAVAQAQIVYQLADPSSSMTGLTINLVENGTQAITNFVYLLNIKTNAYDLISGQSLNGSTTLKLPITNYKNYVSASNQVSMVLRQVYPTRLGALPFNMQLDSTSILYQHIIAN